MLSEPSPHANTRRSATDEAVALHRRPLEQPSTNCPIHQRAGNSPPADASATRARPDPAPSAVDPAAPPPGRGCLDTKEQARCGGRRLAGTRTPSASPAVAGHATGRIPPGCHHSSRSSMVGDASALWTADPVIGGPPARAFADAPRRRRRPRRRHPCSAACSGSGRGNGAP